MVAIYEKWCFCKKHFKCFVKGTKILVLSMLSKQMGHLIYTYTTSQEYEKNINVALKRLQHCHLNKFIFSYLSIISIRNKFGDLDKMVDGNIDIACIA